LIIVKETSVILYWIILYVKGLICVEVFLNIAHNGPVAPGKTMPNIGDKPSAG